MAVGVTRRAGDAAGRPSTAPDLSKLDAIAASRRFAPAFTPLKWTSLFHSCVYTSLLICAFALGKPQPETFVLGWAHGLLWIGMSLACITAARMRVVSLRLAVAVAVLGGIGPFFGSYEFVREQRRRTKSDTPAAGPLASTPPRAPGGPPARGSASQSR
jgi:hypothetical protein